MSDRQDAKQVVPPACDAGLDHIRSSLAALCHLGDHRDVARSGHASPLSWDSVAEHVGDDAELLGFTDRAIGLGLCADVLGSTNQLGVGVAHLRLADPPDSNLVDEHSPGQTVIDDAAALGAATQRIRRESHADRVVIMQTDWVTPIKYGRDIPADDELRLAGDISGGKRALELGIGRDSNAVAFALAGARSIAVDPSPDSIERVRAAALRDEVTVQCHTNDLADLGFATSGSVELVVANHTMVDVDDLSRVLRQVHRVLRSSRPFIISVPHPFAGMHTTDDLGSKVLPYGTTGRTISDWFTHLGRANFRVDQILELGVSSISPVPTTLVIRARKEGD